MGRVGYLAWLLLCSFSSSYPSHKQLNLTSYELLQIGWILGFVATYPCRDLWPPITQAFVSVRLLPVGTHSPPPFLSLSTRNTLKSTTYNPPPPSHFLDYLSFTSSPRNTRIQKREPVCLKEHSARQSTYLLSFKTTKGRSNKRM